ncbi:SPOR domain-containing protein [Breznakiella homolactica]|uniref:SPOR domain-containing protein n=1 Tax=Breznakiella homolactica TaxID=2798577 RepID=A0A7T7XNR5_9SPIR|nr:SPOR domain-containing protein [Breznakiella homolactica]QQO09730.1 SPOR domain-containing protein [Breznakiella homolactica]
MEKKKLLLVAVSVGVFLVIVIGASILVVSPKTGPAMAMAGDNQPHTTIGVPGTQPDSGITGEPVRPGSVDASDMLRNPDDTQRLQTPPGTSTSIQDSTFYIYGESGTLPAAAAERITSAVDSSGRVVIDVPKPATVAVPDAPPPARTVQPPRQPQTVAAAPAPARPAAAPAAQPKPAAVPTREYTDYWVQTGAFSTKPRAEAVKDTLTAKGIKSVIDVRDVDSTTYYRVRVGPYTSENEANYWLSLIKSIDGFEGSQIRTTQSRR